MPTDVDPPLIKMASWLVGVGLGLRLRLGLSTRAGSYPPRRRAWTAVSAARGRAADSSQVSVEGLSVMWSSGRVTY